MLTLFALVLVIGTVVDNAIVVVEAVQAKFDEGYRSAYRATLDAMDGITSALVTTTFIFMAVFIPVSFIGGTTGTFYTQFGLTMAAATLPTGYGFEFGGMLREESSTGNTTTRVFVICVVFIYLILCALYESLFVPPAVILSVPFGLAGSFLFARMFGLENNIYFQTGLIMLIGLLAKTAILLTEYASDRRRDEEPEITEAPAK